MSIARAEQKILLSDLLIVAAIFTAVEAGYWRAGLRFDASWLDWAWQYLDPIILRRDLLRGLFYPHTQPPGFNLFLGTSTSTTRPSCACRATTLTMRSRSSGPSRPPIEPASAGPWTFYLMSGTENTLAAGNLVPVRRWIAWWDAVVLLRLPGTGGCLSLVVGLPLAALWALWRSRRQLAGPSSG